jgi:hypothetical protein
LIALPRLVTYSLAEVDPRQVRDVAIKLADEKKGRQD